MRSLRVEFTSFSNERPTNRNQSISAVWWWLFDARQQETKAWVLANQRRWFNVSNVNLFHGLWQVINWKWNAANMKDFVTGQRQPRGQVTCKAGWGDASSFAKETFISFCPLIRFLADFNASGEHWFLGESFQLRILVGYQKMCITSWS